MAIIRRGKRFLSALSLTREERYLNWLSIFNDDVRFDLYTPEFRQSLGSHRSKDLILSAYKHCPSRDLLTRILRKEPSRADCWLYMSAVVETTKERTFCLENALKYDPENKTARQGLVMLGKLPPDELALPVRPENERKRDDAKIFEPEPEVKPPKEQRRPSPTRQLVPVIGVGLVVIVLVVVGIFGNPFAAVGGGSSSSGPTATFAPLAAAATATRYLSPTPEDKLVSNVVLPTPLTIRLEETYTPTPVYVNTPHPNNEAFTAAMRSYDAGNYGVALGLFEQARDILAETN